MELERVVIVGASAAGLTAAETLRRGGYTGTLTLIGAEEHAPYDRPPLSKQVLSGEWEPGKTVLRAPEKISELGAELLLGNKAIGLDADARTVTLADGTEVAFDGAILATGVVPRRIPGDELAGVHVLRSLDDALALRAKLLDRPKVVIVGAGFLGAEVAASARTMGLEVTMVDPLETPMVRQLGSQLGGLIADLHTAHGVDVRCGVGVHAFAERDGTVTGVELSDGSTVDAGLVVVAVGALPTTDWLAGSGLSIENGIVCDAHCRAAQGIYAAGDVASWQHNNFGQRMRIEHRTNATEQAMAAAQNLLGADIPFTPIPYFWTDQYDLRVQVYGITTPEIVPLFGRPGDEKFAIGYQRNGLIVGVAGWKCPRQLRFLRQLVVESTPATLAPAEATRRIG